eukprot:c17802_g1_i1.p1 GENE.c17802_g1_i1~~c17802_g1_i1.p1  ORF type:complete len:460 (+),score=77.66 c17802_g1_i1:505-1884(+)
MVEKEMGKGAPVLFIETECTDEQVLNANLFHKASLSAKYAKIPMETALARLRDRIEREVRAYEPIKNDHLSYIRTYNLSSKVLANRVYGPLNKSILSALVAWNLTTRPIWLVRCGLAEGVGPTSDTVAYRVQKNSFLANQGKRFAELLAAFIERKCRDWYCEAQANEPVARRQSSLAHEQLVFPPLPPSALASAPSTPPSPVRCSTLPHDTMADLRLNVEESPEPTSPEMQMRRPNSVASGLRHMDSPPMTYSSPVIRPRSNSSKNLNLCHILTSTLARAQETVGSGLASIGPVVQWSQLNPLDKGMMTGMSPEEIQAKFPDWYEEWCREPLDTRFPGGESYSDIMRKLEGVVLELEQTTIPAVVVSHVSVLQVLLAYFNQVSVRDACDLSVPMHTVIQLLPRPDGTWHVKNYPLFELLDSQESPKSPKSPDTSPRPQEQQEQAKISARRMNRRHDSIY